MMLLCTYAHTIQCVKHAVMYIHISCIIVHGTDKRYIAMVSHVMDVYVTIWTHYNSF